MGQAFGPNNRTSMPACRGRRPHLRDIDPKKGVRSIQCKTDAAKCFKSLVPRADLRFFSVPQASDDLGRLLEDNWAVIDKVTSIDVLKAFRLIGQLKDFSKYSDEALWEGIQKKKLGADVDSEDPDDLKSPEWQVFSNPKQAKEKVVHSNFELSNRRLASLSTSKKIVLVEKLREVRGRGFHSTNVT